MTVAANELQEETVDATMADPKIIPVPIANSTITEQSKTSSPPHPSSSLSLSLSVEPSISKSTSSQSPIALLPVASSTLSFTTMASTHYEGQPFVSADSTNSTNASVMPSSSSILNNEADAASLPSKNFQNFHIQHLLQLNRQLKHQILQLERHVRCLDRGRGDDNSLRSQRTCDCCRQDRKIADDSRDCRIRAREEFYKDKDWRRYSSRSGR